MKKRTRYIIDKKYQLRTTFSIIGIVTIITTAILGAITASAVYNNTRLNDNNAKIENIFDIEKNIFTILSSKPATVDPELKKALQAITRNHDANTKTLGHIINYNNKIISYNKILLIAILIIIFAECGILYLILIRKTHHVSGPIYVISTFMKDIIDGKSPKLRPLRNNDELLDFYELFKEMVDSIEKREKKKS